MSFTRTEVIVGALPTGQQASIVSYHVDSGIPGPHVYIQAGIHGNELIGIPVLLELVRSNFVPGSGRLTVVPMANPWSLGSQIMGVQTGYVNFHTHSRNATNWNRIGSSTHPESLEGRWWNALLSLSADADVVYDLHTAGDESVPHIYCHRSFSGRASRLGFSHIIAWEEAGAAFEDVCYLRNQESYTFELGVSRRVTRESFAFAYERVISALSGESPYESGRIYPQSSLLSLYTDAAGILIWDANVGDEVQAGQVLARVIGPERTSEIFAPQSGVFLIKNPIHAPYVGQEIGQILGD